jgi:hypothetical protein
MQSLAHLSQALLQSLWASSKLIVFTVDYN